MRGRNDKGLTLIEMALVLALLSVLTALAVPFVHHKYIRAKEIELKRDLTMMRDAIDRYHEYAVLGQIEPWDVAWNMYPKTLQDLVDGVEVRESADQPPVKIKFLRAIPTDPMTGQEEWSCRGYQDDADTRSSSCDDIYDIFSTSPNVAIDGTYYKDW